MQTSVERAGRKKAAHTYHHGDLYNTLLVEARRLLEEIGPSELSLRAVARRAGVSEAAPSRHFGDKAGLLAGIAATGFDELAAQRLDILARQLPALESARQIMLCYVRYARDNRGVFNLMVGPRIIDRQRHPELEAAGMRSFNLFSDAVVRLALESGWPPRQKDLVAHTAWAVEHGLATLVLAGRAPIPDRHLELDQMIEFAIGMMLETIAAGPLKAARPGSPARSRRA